MAKHKHMTIKKMNSIKYKSNRMKILNADICTCDGKIRVSEENVDDFLDRLETLKRKYS